MIKLRDYQSNLVSEIRNFFQNDGLHLLVQSPTGSGKTIIFSYITQSANQIGNKVLILTDRVELLMQTGSTIKKFSSQPFYIQAGAKFINFSYKTYIAMIHTLRKRLNINLWRNWILKDIDLVVIDEAHKQDFNYIFESGVLDNKKVIGFTATPRRTGKMRQLALDYEEIIEGPSVQELIEAGHLVRDEYYGVLGANLENIKYDRMKGDYSEADMFSRFNSPKLYAGVIDNWLEVAKDTKTLIFCVNIEHVIHTCEEFRKNGIEARFVVTKMSKPKEPDKTDLPGKWVRYEEKMRLYDLYLDSFGKWSGERSVVINKFKKGEYSVLINAGILTTGFDCPDTETIVVNRATTSVTLWLQMTGRGSRPAPGKTHFNLLDFGENATRLGHYTAPQYWSLWHESFESGGGVPPVKECGFSSGNYIMTDENGRRGCMRLIMASIVICPFCGFKYPKQEPSDVELDHVLYDKKKNTATRTKKIHEMDIDELYDYFKKAGHKQPWLWRQAYYKGGIEAIEKLGESKGWKMSTIEQAKIYVKDL